MSILPEHLAEVHDDLAALQGAVQRDLHAAGGSGHLLIALTNELVEDVERMLAALESSDPLAGFRAVRNTTTSDRIRDFIDSHIDLVVGPTRP